jgi:ElaB/YqjD/DUF883 family membrane-anchored ribosome-binding protein
MATSSNIKRNSNDLHPVVKDVHDVRDAAKRIATDGAEAIRETAHHYLDEGRSRVQHLGENVQSKVEEQPLKALLLAAGIGFLVGAIWTRR